jgi:hypothetical protein
VPEFRRKANKLYSAKWNFPETVMKPTLFLLLFCALPPAALAQGGGFSDLLRSVTGAIGGKEASTPAPAGQTAVLGVRGMDEGDAKTAAPATGDLKLLEGWAVGRKEAEAAALRRGLTARPVSYE